MSDYSSFNFRAADLGLDLRDVADEVKEGRWVRLNNVRSTQEALLTSRVGRSLVFSLIDAPVHSFKRLSDTIVLIGVGERLYRNDVVYSYTGTSAGGVGTITDLYSGNPLSIIPFLPERGSDVWAYVADSSRMMKHHADGRVYNWGIAAPILAASAVVVGSGSLNSSTGVGATAYDWRYTGYSSATGAEGNPSPIMGTKATVVNQGVNVTVAGFDDPQVDTIRLYRRGGTNPNQWRLTATGSNPGPGHTTIIRDENSDASIATALPISIDNDVPFTTVGIDGNTLLAVRLPYTAGPFLGKYILAVGDENRPGYLYWTNAGNPDGASSANNVMITSPSEPLIGVTVFNGQAFVMSRDNFYAIDFGQQGFTFRGRKTVVGKGIAAPWAFTVGQLIYFLSRDGIYTTDGESPAESLTDQSLRPIFNGLFASNFAPIDFNRVEECRLSYSDNTLHFIYPDTVGGLNHLTWDALYDRWKSAGSVAYTVTSVYGDENQRFKRTFIGADGGEVFQEGGTDDNGGAIASNARTGSIDLEAPETMKEWGNVILDADPKGGTITITPYLDAESSALPAITVTGTGRQKFARSLSDTFSHSIAFDFDWSALGAVTPIIYQFGVLYRPDEEAIRHWEFPPTSHGLAGWQHVRDGYITARTGATIVMTVEIDGVSYAATFRTSTNTGGEKRKLYFDLPPTKGKLFRYIINSDADFRMYGEDCEVRVKPWIQSLGYQLVSPFRKVQ